MTTDAELLQRYVNERSEAAFAELVQRHVGLVYAAALRQLAGDAHLAQDVAQTVFTALARKAGTLTSRPALAGWLYLSTHHAAAQAVRSDQRRRVREQEAQAMHEILADNVGAAATDWDRVRPVLDGAMRALSEADREAVLLRYFERRPFDEIGAALNTTTDAARMRVERALDKLRVLLGRGGITSTSAALAVALSHQALVSAPAGLARTVADVALTKAAGSAGAAAAGIFMNSSILITGAIALGAIGATVYQTRNLERTEATVAAVTRERDALQMRVWSADRRLVQVEEQVAAQKRQLDGLFAAKTVSLTAAAGSAGLAVPESRPRGSGPQEGQLFLHKTASADPMEARREVRDINGRAIDASYAAFYRQMGWTAVQQAQFRALKLEVDERQSARFRELARAAGVQNTPTDRAPLRAVFEQTQPAAQADLEAALRGAFGETSVEAFRQFQTTIAARPMTNQLASALFDSDSPLTPQQADQLVGIIAANARTPEGKVDLAVLNRDAMLAQAQAVLTPSQLAALRRVDAQRQMDRQMNRDRAPAPKTPGS